MENLKKLVQTRIKGSRKGSDSPNYLHSRRVSTLLKQTGYNEDVVTAGLLHDMIEDSEIGREKLTEIVDNDRVMQLVDLATHDDSIEGKYERRSAMMQRVLDSEDIEAFAVKLADYSDNLTECHTMPNKDSLQQFLLIKGAFFTYRGKKLLNGSALYTHFIETYWNTVNSIYPYYTTKTYKIIKYECFEGPSEDSEILHGEYQTKQEAIDTFKQLVDSEAKMFTGGDGVFNGTDYYHHGYRYLLPGVASEEFDTHKYQEQAFS